MTATALKSTQQMKEALALRSLDDELQVVRGRIEADPRRYGGLMKKLERAEAAVHGRRVAEARDLAIDLKIAVEQRDEAALVRSAVDETISLGISRGEEFVRPTQERGEGIKPVRRLSGLDWLWSKKRLSAAQMAAGLRYGDEWRRATDIRVKSSLQEGCGGDGDPVQEERRKAQSELRKAWGALHGHGVMIDLCNRVAGEGERVRDIAKGVDEEARRLEAILGIALDLLGIHYGIVRA